MADHVGTRKVLVIGGGIAGPLVAMFLQRIGMTPVIYESRSEPNDEAGAFLGLAPNGLAVLGLLGLDEEVRAAGTPTTSIVFENHVGKVLGNNPETVTTIKRGLLNRALREAALARGITVEFGRRLRRVETSATAVTAYFEDGSEVTGDLLVGCDGIHSATRRSLFPQAREPEYTGIVDCGAFTRSDAVPLSDGVMRMTFGVKGFFGYQRVPSGEVFWFENHTTKDEPDRAKLDAIPSAEWRERLVRRHGDDQKHVLDIIRSTQGPIDRWPIYDLPSLERWHKGRVCLVGDAAHASSPHVGQGASLAMEDAVWLAKCLRDVPDPVRAFAVFEDLRRDRVEKIVKEARRTGNQKAPTNVLTRGLRDLVLPFFLRLGVKSTEQIYRYRVVWDEPVKVPSATR
ncbi:FAD-dependent oxidoreductase [Streptomyces sp. 4F14]|uniref:FAD-dependent oxidoreductase n=1 Tax=Streptomyces sp. 4F14 TaxID=3394380 RepID=UPI003A84770D